MKERIVAGEGQTQARSIERSGPGQLVVKRNPLQVYTTRKFSTFALGACARMATLLTRGAWTRLASTGALRIAPTLTNGQTFTWRPTADGEFLGTLGHRVFALREFGGDVEFAEYSSAGASVAALASGSSLLYDFFQLSVALSPLHAEWAAADARMAAIVAALPGVRVLRQPPWECLVAFICSSNNNIARISLMLDRLREALGEPIGRIAAVDGGERVVRAFPTILALGGAKEADLRALGCGYRARFLRESAIAIAARGGDDYLTSLRSQPRDAVQNALLGLTGVGRKVADCVALFSLDKASVVPVDTHVWTIACRDYDATLVEAKSLTPRVYDRVGDLFRMRFSDHAGWAHSLLFTAELPAFRQALPTSISDEMATFREFEREEKIAKRAAARDRKRARELAGGSAVTECGDDTVLVEASPAVAAAPESAPKKRGRRIASKAPAADASDETAPSRVAAPPPRRKKSGRATRHGAANE